MYSESRYQLIRRVAAGGMGEVFIARRTGAASFERRVALKLMQPHLLSSQELVDRFYAEARLVARMHHPNITEIIDVGEADGRPFIAMQLVVGVTLSQLIKALAAKKQVIPLPHARLIATGLCEALAYAHSLADAQGKPLGVVHRDVTPSNVMISTAGSVLLMDFGIARFRESTSHTDPGVVRGKAAYFAPEQVFNDAPIDARTDLYAAGLTLYELLTLDNPYRRKTMEESIIAVSRETPVPLALRRPDASSGLVKAVERAMARAMEDRFNNASELREAIVDGPVATAPELGAYIRDVCSAELNEMETATQEPGEPPVITVTHRSALRPEAMPIDGPSTKARRKKKRRRNLEVLIASILGVVILVAGGATWWVRARSHEAVATQPAPPALTVAPTPVPTTTSVVSTADPVIDVGAPRIESPRPAPVAIERPKSDRPKRTVVARREEPPPVAQRPGFLTADAVPWAKVRIVKPSDVPFTQTTPFTRQELPVGTYTLLFTGPKGTNEERRQVTIKAGQTATVRVDFTQ